MKIFARAFVVFFAIILAGCGTVLEATKSSLSGIKVSSPVTRQVGLRAETHRLIIKNRLHLMSSVAINGKTSDIKLYPNEDVVFSNNFEPFHSAEVSIVLIFREADGSYAGYAEKVFASGSFARSEAWTVFASDVTFLGERLSESDDAPEFEPRVRQFRLPREWFNGTTFYILINDTKGKLRTTTNGAVRTDALAPGEIYTVRTRDWSPSSRWGGHQPVIIQLEGWDKTGHYLGICERSFSPSSRGVRSHLEAVNPNDLRRR